MYHSCQAEYNRVNVGGIKLATDIHHLAHDGKIRIVAKPGMFFKIQYGLEYYTDSVFGSLLLLVWCFVSLPSLGLRQK